MAASEITKLTTAGMASWMALEVQKEAGTWNQFLFPTSIAQSFASDSGPILRGILLKKIYKRESGGMVCRLPHPISADTEGGEKG